MMAVAARQAKRPEGDHIGRMRGDNRGENPESSGGLETLRRVVILRGVWLRGMGSGLGGSIKPLRRM